MNKSDLRIVFMGTPTFAVESLRALVEGGYTVAGVVTTPDKPIGKHQSILQPSPVKQYAQAQGLPLLQPERLKDPRFLEQLQAWAADLCIVVAFRMLPEAVWAMPRYGSFNLHASLLPQYRGAAPIQWAIMNGETETGVTTFFLTHTIDTGRILFREATPITNDDDAGTLHDRLMTLGAHLVLRTVDALLVGTLHPQPQVEPTDGTPLKTAPKIFKDTCRIDWNRPTTAIHHFIRGLAPHPGAWTELTTTRGETLTLKIFSAEPLPTPHDQPAGTFRTDGKTHLDLATADGWIRVQALQPAGKKRMAVADFLRGLRDGDHPNNAPQ
jgi:methionyl-tRNA formyltransferase